MKLSFIVPIYKVEQYLRKCVDSLLCQDYDDYEIILVDDGGTDGCPAICDEYAAQYDNIRVVHRENGGLSAARNSGIEIAQGEYLCFVDSDDYWEPNVLGELMTQIERDNLDVLRYNYRNIDEEGTEIARIPNPWGTIGYSQQVSDGASFLNTRLGYACYAWQFVVRASLVHNDKFTEGILFEDTDWTPRILIKAERVAETSAIVYNYMIRQAGITQSRSVEKMQKEFHDKLNLIGKLHHWNDIYHLDWYKGMTASLTISILKLVARYQYEKKDDYIDQLKQYKVFPLTPYHLRRKASWNARLINLSPKLYILIQHCK